jgi:hypothetical protein
MSDPLRDPMLCNGGQGDQGGAVEVLPIHYPSHHTSASTPEPPRQSVTRHDAEDNCYCKRPTLKMRISLGGTSRRHQCAAAALLLALATAPLAHAASKCYFPSGDEATDLVPCSPDALISMCCRTRDACLSSGLCLRGDTGEDSGDSYERGGCTYRSWKSPYCPQHCLRNLLPPPGPNMPPIYNIQNTVALVWQCAGQGYRKAFGEYCCEDEADKPERYCCSGRSRFTLGAATLGNAFTLQTTRNTESTGPTPSTTTSSTDTTKTSESSSETGKLVLR